MTLEDRETAAFLYELYRQSDGDTEKQVDSNDIGQALGIESDLAGSLAEQLCIMGFAELKTLSGGIGITVEGMKALDVTIPAGTVETNLTFGNDIVLSGDGIKLAQDLIDEISKTAAAGSDDFEQTEELVIDIKTIQVQLLSSKPKTRIIKEIFRSIQNNLEKRGNQELSGKLKTLVDA